MSAIKNSISILVLFVFACSAQASASVAQDASSEFGSMMLFSAGFVGLFAARKHMKSEAS
ncbi:MULTISPECIES: hypothetical protein [unclassified Oleiphilus]|uniref:hypothetical protein n=1 Tax=unclassified Oleiphilus TaxID=2631174 RepID=UPI0007C35CE9|nr:MULTISPECIES: hypothetical protein [unclassified Oleiphilus]KZY42966.1 hypothetical protein A3732_15380 [Oleiphilus sp. HI0050]KZY76185.1 hypothetical protein A3741_11360 [Oleiphilus sp. HI0069]KZY78572.1 hypothetical protein A3740_00140 [Oleiphilus sp. HI0068]KZY89626.1 hypothetical protein A3743_07935 [Oleiphilus sp. HI0072]KZZ12433.1 hypothetical protein A3749_06325 [Oleiphilus sp. HI0078]KZZ22507.1 hypothetical protein A3752_06240 [Oleiphilus sp. HI0081]KZZ39857.1 hypothetical protein